MNNKLIKIIHGEDFNKIEIIINKNKEIEFSCMDSYWNKSYVELNIDKAKELVEAINTAITKIEEEINNEN
jgi:hypothetical protein